MRITKKKREKYIKIITTAICIAMVGALILPIILGA
jgi:hypothetical protein